MENVKITETESRYYNDLFLFCDTDKLGVVTINKCLELFKKANLPLDLIKQILSIAGASTTANSLTRVQFYSCLKLIAAHQSAVPIKSELISAPVQLSLPRFNWTEPNPGSASGPNELQENQSDILNNEGHRDDTNNLDANGCIESSDMHSTDSEVDHGDKKKSHYGSPEAWSTASDSPTPTNSVAERPWTTENLWQGLLCEEQRQLLGTEEESSDKHSSDEENADIETIYQITSEQREYYIKQFQTLQPNPTGLITGHIARVFFEKSRIPIKELRHIWQLCDVTKDGALNLNEFIAAMHLVVLRRNNICLPPALPLCLMTTITDECTLPQPTEENLLQLSDDERPSDSGKDSNQQIFNRTNLNNSVGKLIDPTSDNNRTNKTVNSSYKSTSNSSSPVRRDISPSGSDTNKSRDWTTFNESPVLNICSPKPVLFDMQKTVQAVGCDPLILHPVPLRVTPVASGEALIEHESQNNHTNNLDAAGVKYATRDTPNTTLINNHGNDFRSIQRPQAKKLPTGIGAIPPPPPQRDSVEFSHSQTNSGSSSTSSNTSVHNNNMSNSVHPIKNDPTPPPPPPRHTRSSSLDLNKLKFKTTEEIARNLPSEVSEQVDGNNTESFADFSNFSTVNKKDTLQQMANLSLDETNFSKPSANNNISILQTSQRNSAFEVYRKPERKQSGENATTVSVGSNVEQSQVSESILKRNENKSLNEVLRHLKDQNMLLLRLCNDLSEELLTVQYKKEELRCRLE